MWNLQINADYKIISDESQYIVQKSYQSKDKDTGETSVMWKNKGYSSDLSGAVTTLFKLGVRCADVRTIADAQIAAQEWLQTITNAFVPYGLDVSRKVK
jgi:hypothetical protein